MVTASINNAGVTRRGTFGRSSEYIYVVQVGAERSAGARRWLRLEPSADQEQVDDLLEPCDTKRRERSPGQPTESLLSDLRPQDARQCFIPSVSPTWETTMRASKVRMAACPSGRSATPASTAHGRSRHPSRNLITEHVVRLAVARRPNHDLLFEIRRAEETRRGFSKWSAIEPMAPWIVDDSTAPSFVPTDVAHRRLHDAGTAEVDCCNGYFWPYVPFPKSLCAVEDTIRFFVRTRSTLSSSTSSPVPADRPQSVD